jgi:hypothetical protein
MISSVLTFKPLSARQCQPTRRALQVHRTAFKENLGAYLVNFYSPSIGAEMLITKQDDTIPKQQPRPVRDMFTPTQLRFCSQLPWNSVSHQAIVVGDPTSPDGVLISELRRPEKNNKIIHTTKTRMLSSTRVEELKKAPIYGYTFKTDEEIGQYGKPCCCFDLISPPTPCSSLYGD